jgi:hypothetical protein
MAQTPEDDKIEEMWSLVEYQYGILSGTKDDWDDSVTNVIGLMNMIVSVCKHQGHTYTVDVSGLVKEIIRLKEIQEEDERKRGIRR